MSLRLLSVAYPLAPVGTDTAGGAEQILAQIDRALTHAGHRSFVIACEGSSVADTLLSVPSAPRPSQRKSAQRHEIDIDVPY